MRKATEYFEGKPKRILMLNFENLLKRVEEQSIKRDQELEKQINKCIKQQNKTEKILNENFLRGFLVELYKQSSIYNKVILIIGYAGLFTTWQMMFEYIDLLSNLIISILILFSIMIFAGWEVFQMIFHSIYIMRVKRIIDNNISDSEKLKAFQCASENFHETISKYWIYQLVPTVLSGFGAGVYILIMFSLNFIEILS